MNVLTQISKIIKNYKSVIIFHHINPDGDCLGSQFGLKELIQDNFSNIKVYAIGDSKNIFPFMNFKHDKIPNEKILQESLAIVVDANFTTRIQDAMLITENKVKAVLRIDHHLGDDDLNPIFKWVDPSYCASAEQVAELAIKLSWKISPQAAKFLYLGIYTDSGRFLYDKTSTRTFKLVAELLATKFDVQNIHNNLLKKTKEELLFQKEVLNNYQTKGNVIYYFLTQEKINALKVSESGANRVDFLANFDPYKIWIFFIEEESGKIRIRLRSSTLNVHQIATKYGGGGHEKASGAIIDHKEQMLEVIEFASQIAK